MTTATPITSYSHGIRLPDCLSRIVGRFPVPDETQELDLIRKARKGHEKSMTWLMVANVRLVCKLASKYAFFVLDSQDLIQEGFIGIRHAIQKFDPKKGIRFSTYAYWWILRYVRRFCNKNRMNQLRLPEEHQLKLDRIRKAQSDSPIAGIEEIAEKLKLELEYAENLLFWGRRFQHVQPNQEFASYDVLPFDEDEIIDLDIGELESQIEVLQLIPPQPSVAESISAHLQTPARYLAQWFRVGVSQFVSAAKGQERPRIGCVQESSIPSKCDTGQERVNLSTWPVSLSFSYRNSLSNIPPTQSPTEPSPSIILSLVKGVFAHVQVSPLVLCRDGRDGAAARPGYQSSSASERCRGLGETGTSRGGYLGFCRSITAFILKPFASVIQSIRGFTNRDGPVPKPGNRKGAVFDLPLRNKGTPQQHHSQE